MENFVDVSLFVKFVCANLTWGPSSPRGPSSPGGPIIPCKSIKQFSLMELNLWLLMFLKNSHLLSFLPIHTWPTIFPLRTLKNKQTKLDQRLSVLSINLLKSIIGRESYYVQEFPKVRLALCPPLVLYFHEVQVFQWPHWFPAVLVVPLIDNQSYPKKSYNSQLKPITRMLV